MTLTGDRFELRNRNRSTVPSASCAVVLLEELDTDLKHLLFIDGKCQGSTASIRPYRKVI